VAVVVAFSGQVTGIFVFHFLGSKIFFFSFLPFLPPFKTGFLFFFFGVLFW